MLSYLTKFNNLPQALREKVSTPAVMQAIGEMEKKYSISLAILVMKIMAKELAVSDLGKYLMFEHGLDDRQAKRITSELKSKVFFSVAEYLGITAEVDEAVLDEWMEGRKENAASRDSTFYFSSEDEEEVKVLAKKVADYSVTPSSGANDEANAERIINELKLNFSSSDLNNRFIQVIKTYLKGIRNKINAREALTKQVDYGGLGLNNESADKIFKLADSIKVENIATTGLKPPASMQTTEEKLANTQYPALKNVNAMPLKNEDSSRLSSQAIKTQSNVAPVSLKTPDVAGFKNGQALNIGRDFAYDFNSLRPAVNNEAKGESQTAAPENAISDIKELNVQKQELESKIDFSSSNEAPRPDEEIKRANYEEIIARAKKIAQAANIKSEPLNSGRLEPVASDSSDPMMNTGAESNFQNASKSAANKSSFMAKAEFSDNDASAIKYDVGIVKARRTKSPEGKVRMDDVKYVPKLMGPIDELREMDLVNFRRLDSDSGKAADKIIEKINFLEDESYSQRLSGIKAWRQSPMNRLYLSLGEESIISKKPIHVIVDNRKSGGGDYITGEEFTAIMELNKELRY